MTRNGIYGDECSVLCHCYHPQDWDIIDAKFQLYIIIDICLYFRHVYSYIDVLKIFYLAKTTQKKKRISLSRMFDNYRLAPLKILLKDINVREEKVCLIGREVQSTLFCEIDAVKDYNLWKEESSWEFSGKCALRDIHRFDPSVRLYTYFSRAYSVLHATPPVIKRENVSPPCFNAMKTVGAHFCLRKNETCLFQRVHFLVRTSRLSRKKFQQWN